MPLEMSIESLGDRVGEVRRAIYHLQNKQFVVASAERSGHVRRTLGNPALRDFIARWFDLAGYDLQYNEQEGWYGILPRIDEVTPPRMKPTHTLILFALALHWQNCVENGQLSSTAEGVSTFNEFWLDLEDRIRNGNGPALTADKVLEILKNDFKPKGIVEIGDIDPETDNYDLFIRPFVRLLAGEEALTRLNAFIDRKEAQEAAASAAEQSAWDAAAPDDDDDQEAE